MNPKILHIIAEVVQIGGVLGGAASVAGSLNPFLGTACIVAGGIATALKPLLTIPPAPQNPAPSAVAQAVISTQK